MTLGEYRKLHAALWACVGVPVPGTHPVRLPRQTGQGGSCRHMAEVGEGGDSAETPKDFS